MINAAFLMRGSGACRFEMIRVSKVLFALILVVVLLLPAAVQAGTGAPENGILPCTYTAPDDAQSYTAHLCDGNDDTTVTLYRGEQLTMTFEKGAYPDALFFDFYELPDSYEVLFCDADGGVLERFWTNEIPGHHVIMPVEVPDAACATLKATDRTLSISEWYACTNAFVPPFADTGERADVLVVLNEPGDELKLFGGLFAQLAGEHGLSVQVDYLTKADAYRTHQCIAVLRGMGIERLPYFGKGRTPRGDSDNAVYNAVGTRAELLERYTKRIRALQPKLILTLDTSRDAARYADHVIADVIRNAAEFAANAERYPGTEAFAVSKIYSLSDSGSTVISTETPLYAYEGVTAAELADTLSHLYREERVFRLDMPDTVRFALIGTTVGEDEACNDLLEHLSTDRFAGYRVPTPTPVPTPEPTEIPTPTATPQPTDLPVSEQTEPAETAAAATQTPAPTEPPAKRKGLFSCGGKEETPAPTAEPVAESTPEPTALPTPEPTAEPTEIPTPEPTAEPTPDPNDAYFLSEDGEEYELDFSAGHWRYKSRVLSIDITRTETTISKNRPLVYYVAHIRMREYSSYRSGVHTAYQQPWRYVRQEKAVFAITGDNLDVAEKNLKGLLLRKGVFYSNEAGADTLLIGEDMTLRVLHRKAFTTRQVIDSGVRDTYSFGPILVENGEINEAVGKHHVAHANPRCGIGMVEPGYWIAIVTDGRQPHYSYSISLEYFAELFHSLGCTVAYNLDGGSSAAMCFMGEELNKHLAPGTDDTQRPWIDALMIGYSELLPSVNTPTKHDGFHH